MAQVRMWLGIPGLFLLLAAAAAADTGAGADPPGGRLRVVTINVWSGLDYKGSLRMGEYETEPTRALRTAVLVEELKELDADVIGFNEANKLPRYARELSKRLGYDWIYHVGLGGLRVGPLGLPVNLREGDVILAGGDLKLQRAGRKQLSGGPVGNVFTAHFADATQVVAGRIQLGGREVYLFCTHWHASPFPTDRYFEALGRRLASGRIDRARYEELKAEAIDGAAWRLDEARKTVAFIDRVAGDHPVILFGDFNAESDAPEIALLRAAAFRDAYTEAQAKVQGETRVESSAGASAGSGMEPGYTWDGKLNSNIQLQVRRYPEDFWLEPTRKRIDYIFFRGRGLEVREARVVLNRPRQGLYPSDHFGVLADIEFQGR